VNESYRELRRDLAEQNRAVREHVPDVYKGFEGLAKAAMAEGALSRKVKELIALAMAIAEQCDGCIAAHAAGAARAGATDAEVAETIGVAVLMRGGPGTVYGPRAMTAFLEYAATEGG
jgi:AhpD family alkylhydroperoxidase